jgi:hypothetical protein
MGEESARREQVEAHLRWRGDDVQRRFDDAYDSWWSWCFGTFLLFDRQAHRVRCPVRFYFSFGLGGVEGKEHYTTHIFSGVGTAGRVTNVDMMDGRHGTCVVLYCSPR